MTTSPKKPTAKKNTPPKPIKPYRPSEEQLEQPWLRQPWDTPQNWIIFGTYYCHMSSRTVTGAHALWARDNGKRVGSSAPGSVLLGASGKHHQYFYRLRMINAKGQEVEVPTWVERAIAFDNHLTKRMIDDIAERQNLFAAKAQFHLHNNTMNVIEALAKSIRAYQPGSEKIGELVSAQAKIAELTSQLYLSHVPDNQGGKVVSTETQVRSTAEKLGRIADILMIAKERNEAALGEKDSE